LGILSTYYGLIIAFISFYNILVKKFYISLPLKYFKTSSHSGFSLKSPKFGFILLANIYSAVDLPIPFVPTNPNTWPGFGVGSLWSLKEFMP
jgi:hypothetical protein